MKAKLALVLVLVLIYSGLWMVMGDRVYAQPRPPAQVYVPVNPQVVSVSGTAATSGVILKPYYTLHTTVSIFYRVDGRTATASGAVCHYLMAGASVDLYANRGTTVSAIAADGSSTGFLYITEWE